MPAHRRFAPLRRSALSCRGPALAVALLASAALPACGTSSDSPTDSGGPSASGAGGSAAGQAGAGGLAGHAGGASGASGGKSGAAGTGAAAGKGGSPQGGKSGASGAAGSAAGSSGAAGSKAGAGGAGGAAAAGGAAGASGSGAASGASSGGAGGAAGAGAAGSSGAAGSAPACGGDRALGVAEPFPDSMLIQNGGRVYNIRKPPTATQHAAAGDGSTDDTAALQDAWDYLKAGYVATGSNSTTAHPDANFWVYLPDGTYLVSDTLIYRGPSLEAPTGYDWNDVVNVRFVGESREGTVLRLADHAPGFDQPGKPKIVLAYQHPDTRFNNLPANNVLRNLTVDVGHGNPGAVGVYFQGANLSEMRNVRVRSGDGAGRYGFWIKAGSAQGYFRDLTVEGFDYGIYQTENGEVDTSWEHVTLRGQAVAAIAALGGGLSGRDVCADESQTAAQGVRVEKTGAQVVLLDSTFTGSGVAQAAIEATAASRQSLFARGVSTSGYGAAVVVAGATKVAGPNVDEWVLLPPVTLSGSGPARTLKLAIKDTPLIDWFHPATDWASVDDYGAVGDGKADDAAAVDKAMASGKPVVVFPRARYHLGHNIMVPASVARVDVMFADVDAGFVVSEASGAPILLEGLSGYGGVTLAAARTVVMRGTSGGFRDTQGAPVEVYLENCANIGGGDAFAPANQTTWARALNDEQGGGSTGDIVVVGGTAWIFDYKTENKPVSSLVARGGARVEVFNGYINTTSDPMAFPIVVNDSSRVSFIGFTSLGGNQWTTAITEKHGAAQTSLPYLSLPPRDNNNVFIPLYEGDLTAP